VDRRIDVGIESVLVGILQVPRRRWLFFGQANADYRLDAFEAILPRHDQSDGGAILVRQRLAIEADRQDGERVQGLIEPQPLDIGPWQRLEDAPLPRHFRGTHQRLKSDGLGAALRLHTLKHACKWHADPRNNHRPALNTPQTVNALL